MCDRCWSILACPRTTAAARVIHILNKSDNVDAADIEAVLNMFDGGGIDLGYQR